MARKKGNNRKELRDLAISHAKEIISNEGLANLTARKLAKKIGYSVGTLYNIFENIDELILIINAQTLEEIRLSLNPAIKASQKAPYESLVLLAHSYVNYMENNENKFSAIFDHKLSKEKTIPDWYQKKIDDLFLILEEIFEKMLPSINPKQKKKAAKVLWTSLHGTCSLAVSKKLNVGKEESPAFIAELLVTTFVAGLKALEG